MPPREATCWWLGVATAPGCGPQPDFVVEGVNLTRLTAPPRPGEVDSVRAEWDASGSFADVLLTEVASFEASDGGTAVVYAGVTVVAAGSSPDTVMFAGIYAPPRPTGSQLNRGLLVVLQDLGGVARMEPSASPLPLIGVRDRVAVLSIAFSGQSILADGRTYTPRAAPAYYQREAKRVWNAVLQLRLFFAANLIDRSRISVVGNGYGATLAGLVSQQSPVDLLLAVQPIGSFFGDGMQEEYAKALRGQLLANIPTLEETIAETVFQVRDGRLTVNQARVGLLQRSPAHFSPRAAFTVITTGTDIIGIPASQGADWAARLSRANSVLIETDAPTVDDVLGNPSLDNFVSIKLREFGNF